MHAEFGIPIALNVGDFLLGEGYRLLTELELPQDRKAKMLKVAAHAHRQLCLGQGMELQWVQNPKPLSIALGIAYQIKDDINDFDDVARSRPSVLLAIAWEKAQSRDRQLIESLWQNDQPSDAARESVTEMAARLKIKTIAMKLMETYKQQAVSCLESMEDISFKSLLRRIVSKIFNEIDIMGCCDDYKTPND